MTHHLRAWRLLRASGPLQPFAVAQALGLSRTLTGKVLRELVAKGCAVADGHTNSRFYAALPVKPTDQRGKSEATLKQLDRGRGIAHNRMKPTHPLDRAWAGHTKIRYREGETSLREPVLTPVLPAPE